MRECKLKNLHRRLAHMMHLNVRNIPRRTPLGQPYPTLHHISFAYSVNKKKDSIP